MPRAFRHDPPSLSERHLLRPRLLDRLRQRWRAPLTLVIAGPGFGKSTLLAQALVENRLERAGTDHWLGCEPQDSAAAGLGAGLLAALGAPVPTVAADPETWARRVHDALWCRAPEEVCLVLDDVHEVAPGSAGAAFLGAVVAELPANVHVVLASRRPPPFPAARLIATGAEVVLDEECLAFDGAEGEAFARLRGTNAASLGDLGGWPALVELVVDAGRSHATEYLFQEVLDTMTPERRRLLALLTAIGGGDDELATAITGAPVEAGTALADIPLVARGRRGEHVPHPLWRDALREELDDVTRRRAQQAAADVLRRRHELPRAVELLLTAEAWDDLMVVFRAVALAVRPPVHHSVVSAWLQALPDSYAHAPAAELLAAVVLKERNPELAMGRLRATMSTLAAGGDADAEVRILAHLGHLAWWRSDTGTLETLFMRALELEAAGVAAAGPYAAVGRAALADLRNEASTALTALDAIPPGTLADDWALAAELLRSRQLVALGRPHDALAVLESLKQHAGPEWEPSVRGARHAALWLAGAVEEVVADEDALLADAQATGTAVNLAIRFGESAYVHAMMGETNRARRDLESARTVGGANESARALLALATAACAIAADDEEEAAAVLRTELSAHRLDHGLGSRVHLWALPLTYVLVPEAREHWEAAELGPAHRTMRALARALAQWREARDPAPLVHLAWPGPGPVRAALPVRWAAELATGLAAAARPDAEELATSIGAAGRAALRDLTHRAAGPARAARALLAATPATPARRLELRVLGPTKLTVEGTDVGARDWRRRQVRRLLLYLVTHPDSSRDAVMTALWPEFDGHAAANNLRVTLSYLLNVLEPERAAREASYFVRAEGNRLTLVTGEHLWVDRAEFERLLDTAGDAERSGVPSAALDRYCEASALWLGEPLAEAAYDEWAQPERQRLTARFVSAAGRAAELLAAARRTEEAVTLAQRALEYDPSWSPARTVLAGLRGSEWERGGGRATR